MNTLLSYDMGPHRVTCHPTLVNAPHLTLTRQLASLLTHMKGYKAVQNSKLKRYANCEAQ